MDDKFIRDHLHWDSQYGTFLVDSPIAAVGECRVHFMNTAPSGWLVCNGAAVSRTDYGRLFNFLVPVLGNMTVTIASPAVATLTAHGLITGDPIYLTTSGALPTGLTANTIYYVIKVTADSFNLATTRANAVAGTKINTSGTQSGAHQLFYCPYGLGDGSTTFNIPDLANYVPAGFKSGDTNFSNIGKTLGAQTHTLQLTEIPGHTHTLGSAGRGALQAYNGVNGDMAAGTNATFFGNTTSSAGGGGSHNNVQPSLTVNYIIKA